MTMDAKTQNPHWIDERPAWDIVLPNGEIDKGVTDQEVGVAVRRLDSSRHIDVVRKYDIDSYAKYRESHPRIYPL